MKLNAMEIPKNVLLTENPLKNPKQDFSDKGDNALSVNLGFFQAICSQNTILSFISFV